MSVEKEVEMVALARKMDLFSIVYVASPAEAESDDRGWRGRRDRARGYDGRRRDRGDRCCLLLGGGRRAHAARRRGRRAARATTCCA